jgi:glycerophosphoryl diester phosphodiesterase
MNPLLDLHARPVIGHRGASGYAPENTLPAFALALEQQADALEFDVRLSADGVPVVMHDPTLDRTCGRAVPVQSLLAREIIQADAGFGFSTDGGVTRPWRERGATVPLVELVLERFPGIPLLIEVKEVRAAQPLADLLRRHAAERRVVVASFLEEALAPFRDPPPLPLGASRRGITRLLFRSFAGLAGPRGRYAVYAVPDRYRDWIPVPTRRFIRAARRSGCPVHVWTVNDAERAGLLWRRGASGMITNYPDRLVEARRRLAL